MKLSGVVRTLASGLLCVAAAPVAAFFDPPTIVPVSPAYGQLVSVSIHGGGCDRVYDFPEDTDITRTGNVVRIVIDGANHFYGIPCPGFPYTVAYPLGYFGPGTYTVEVVHRYEPNSDPPRLEEATIGFATFTVAAPAAT